MKASLDQCIDCQVKCDRSIQIGAAKWEIVVMTMTTTTRKAAVVTSIWKGAKRCRAEPFPSIEAESKKPNLFLKAELTADRTPAKEPILWKREGEALTSPGNPLANLTTVKFSWKNFRKLQAERVWKVCFARFIQSSIYPPWPNPSRMHLTCTIQVVGYPVLFGGWWSVVWRVYLIWWSGLTVVVCSGGLFWWSDLVVGSDDGLLWY